MCECYDEERNMDMITPRNVHLSALYKRSFAFHTVKTRMPVILTSLLDNLVRNKSKIFEQYGEQAKEDLKTVIGKISELKYEIQTNKPMKPLTSAAPDSKIYNDYIATQASIEGPPTYFRTIWLLTECYMYRRINQMFEESNSLKNYDPFGNQKMEAYFSTVPLIIRLGAHLISLEECPEEDIEKEFIHLLKVNLWGNRCDLSISLGQVTEDSSLFNTDALEPNIISDYSQDIWKAVSNNGSDIIDWVLDNAGYELFTDLCLADFIITKKLAKTIRFYVKTIPWFISDVMASDFHWILHKLDVCENKHLETLSLRWKSYLNDQTWIIVESNFWTLPFDYTHMKTVNPDLYKQLGEAKIAFFKGDLNYRKLFGEINWNPATPIDEGLQGFHPTKLCILRTIKADIICGLEKGVAEKIEKNDPKWKETGNWGLIQYSNKVVKIE